jgi:UDP-N-acetylglucosamine 3-dehydrogenase
MIRLVVVGLGKQGQRYLRVVRDVDGAEVVAGVDPWPKVDLAMPCFPDIESAMAAVDADAAIVASPTALHGDHASELIDHKIPVLVEKPLAATASAATGLARKAAEAGVLVATGHVERFNPAVQLVKSMLEKGEIGKPISLSLRRVGLPPRSGHDQGVVHDLAVHDIDVFSYLIGSPALTGAVGWPQGRAPEAAFLLISSGEVDGSVEVNWRTPVRIRTFTVTTDTCVVSADYTTQKVELIEAAEGANPIDFLAFQAQYSYARRSVFEPPTAEPLRLQLESFVAKIEGGSSSVLASADDGARAVAIAEEATEMIATRR